MKLYELTWSHYPRRVGIYIAEKGITGIERAAFDALAGWPPPEIMRLNSLGTVPVLQTDDGTLIRSSVAILEYLEERFPMPDMIGATPETRARTRELMSVVDEAAINFVSWCHRASPLFAGQKTQDPNAATIAADAYYDRLRLLDRLASETAGPFLTGKDVGIADCSAIATLQFAEQLWDVPLPSRCPALTAWYANFQRRPSVALAAYPEPLLAAARGLPGVSPPTDP